MNEIPKELMLSVGAALLCAFAVSFLMCPLVKSFAYKIGAIDVPKDNRRMHKKPVPRLGGLAIFLGFMVSILLFVCIDHQLRGILLGASIIVVLGVVDDMSPLRAYFKFCVQVAAALVAVFHGVVIEILSNPNVFASNPYWELNWLSIPITVLWIVGITNAVNLIDGLDGLACGVSTISAVSMLVIALLVSEGAVALVMASLVGACLGFMPYNRNPAKMFMGDTGSTFLGYILATISIQGLFKYYAIVSFAVPFLILGLPMFDTLFAIIRRLAHGQNPMAPDRGHIHHRLIDMGLNQKQAVAALYVISSILGLSAVVLTSSGAVKAMLLLMALAVAAFLASRVIFRRDIDRAAQADKAAPEQSAEMAGGGSGDPAGKENAEPDKEGKGDA
ncbi:MAG: MraY family glycosyltransferase [Oscillospiraceae bacterium]|nr:MraY family glycosyltransferase [Oscillospiraceae bacterium]